MNNDRFKEKIQKLEQEREDFINKLRPKRQQEFRQKEEENLRKELGSDLTTNDFELKPD